MDDGGFSFGYFMAEGGASMWAALCCGSFGNTLALVALGVLVARKRAAAIGVGAATLLAGVGTLGVGVLGYWLGVRAVDQALLAADAAFVAEMRERGLSEAANNLWLGGLASAVPLLVGALAIAVGALLPRGRDDRAE